LEENKMMVMVMMMMMMMVKMYESKKNMIEGKKVKGEREREREGGRFLIEEGPLLEGL
jgi:hypothetical protein